MPCSSSRNKLFFFLLYVSHFPGVKHACNWIYSIASETSWQLSLLGLHNIIALQPRSFSGTTWWHLHVWVGKMEKVEGTASLFWPLWAAWEFRAPVYTLAPKSQRAFHHSASVNHQDLSLPVAKSKGTMEPGHLPSPRPQITFAVRTTSASYERKWYFTPQLHRYLLASSVLV